MDTDSALADEGGGSDLYSLQEHLSPKGSAEAEKCGHESIKGQRNIQQLTSFYE